MNKNTIILYLLVFLQTESLCQISDTNYLNLEKKGDYYFEKSDSFSIINKDSCRLYLKLASDIFLKLNQWSKGILCLNGLGVIAYKDEEYELAFFYFNQLEKLSKLHLDSTDLTLAYLLNNLAYLEREKGNYFKSYNMFKQAINITVCNNSEFKYKIIENLAGTFYLLGDYSSGLNMTLNAINEIKSKKIILNISNFEIYKTTGLLYLALNKNKEALIFFDQAKKIIDKEFKYNNSIKKEKQFSVNLKISECLIKLNDLERLYRILTKLDESIDEINDNYLADYYSLKAKFYFSKKDTVNSIKSINNTLKIIKNKSNYFSNSKKIKYLLEKTIYISEIDPSESLRLIDSTLYYFSTKVSLKKADNSNALSQIEAIKQKIYLSKKYFSYVNHDNWNKLLTLTKSLRQQNSTASHKDFWANENLEIFQDAIATFVNTNDLHTAFIFAEANKSNLLIQSLNDVEAKTYAGIPEYLIDKERDLKAKLQFYQQKKFELESSDNIDTAKLLSFSDAITQTDFEIEAIIDTLENQYPEYYELKYDEKDLTIHDVQELLDNETAFLEYFVGKDSTYLFTITKNNTYVSPIENINSNTNTLINYYNSISNPNTHSDTLDHYSQLAYKLIVKSAIDQLPNQIKNLVIVPDDVLNNLPFGLLKNNTKNKYLGDQYNIHYQYSGRLWRMLKNRTSKVKKYDLVGYAYNANNLNFIAERACATMQAENLLCSERELGAIAHILKDNKVVLGQKTKKEVLDQAADCKILHLATHACLDTENSDYSRIFFDDGYVTNIDLQLQKIDADLAVLSACESGYGALVKGEGAMSISKGFFHAGVKSTVVSLWPVDDCSTAEFMAHFYTFLKEGDNKDVALSKAKKQYQKTAHPSRTHPYYWAGFILIGDNDAVWSNEQGIVIYGLLALSLVAILTLVFFMHKQRNTTF